MIESLMKEKTKKIVIVSTVGIPVIIFTVFCGYKIYLTGKPLKDTTSINTQNLKRPVSESDRVWGAIPSSACAALANANVVTTPYTLLDAEKNLYGCSTSEIEIPNQKSKKTLQYSVTGFNDKATNIKLVMQIVGSQVTEEAVVAKKSWAIYSAVLAQTVFSQQLSEDEMQKMVQLKNGENFKKNYNFQLISDAKFEQKKNVGVYTYEIRGLPVLNGE